MAKVFSLHGSELAEVQLEAFHNEEDLVHLLEVYGELISFKGIGRPAENGGI